MTKIMICVIAHFINKFILNGPLRTISDILGDNKMAEI